MAGFGLFADDGEKPAADSTQVANEAVEQPATQTSQHCEAAIRNPLVAMGRQVDNP